MNKIILLIIFVMFTFFLPFDQFMIKKNNQQIIQKVEKIDEEKISKEDTKAVKEYLLKFLAKQIKKSNFIDKYCINKTLDQISKELSIYYSKFANFFENPEEAIKLAHEMLHNCQEYIEAANIQLKRMKKKLKKDYEDIKYKYCTNLYENIFNDETWKTRITLNEIEKVYDLEAQLEEIDDILNIINRIQILFKVTDWTIYSYSPLAWVLRKYFDI